MRTVTVQLLPGEHEVSVVVKAAEAVAPAKPVMTAPAPRPTRPGPSLKAQQTAAAISEIVRLVADPLGKRAKLLKAEAKRLAKELGVKHEHHVDDPVIQRSVLALFKTTPRALVDDAVQMNLWKIDGLAESIGSAAVCIAARELLAGNK